MDRAVEKLTGPQVIDSAFEPAGVNDPDVQRIRRHFDRYVGGYDRMMTTMERILFRDGRAWACSRARGDVLEVAVGTGLNLEHYPKDARLTGIDVSESMLEVAGRRAKSLAVAVDLRHGNAHCLPFPNGSFDSVVFTLSLCTIPDPAAAVAEARRVLRAGGGLILLEHVRSHKWIVRAIERLIEPVTLWFEGDHLLREPLEYLLAEGFEIVNVERTKAGIMERVVAIAPS